MHFVIDKVSSSFANAFPRFVLYVCALSSAGLALFKEGRQQTTSSQRSSPCGLFKVAKVIFRSDAFLSPTPEQVLSSVCRYTRCASAIDRAGGYRPSPVRTRTREVELAMVFGGFFFGSP